MLRYCTLLLLLIYFNVVTHAQNLDSLMKKYPIVEKVDTDTLLFDSRQDHGLLLSFDYMSKNLYYGYTPFKTLTTRKGGVVTTEQKPFIQASLSQSARYTFTSGLYFQAGANALRPDNVTVALYDVYIGWNYKLIKDHLGGYLQLGHYFNNANTINLRSAMLNGYEGNMEYQNNIVNVALTYSGDYSQTSTVRDIYSGLALSHDFYFFYDIDEGALSLTPSNDAYFGSIRSTNIIAGKTVKQLIKQYGRKQYKKHLNELYSQQNYNSGFGYLYNLTQLSLTYERKRWATSLIGGLAIPDKNAPLPQTLAKNQFIFSFNFSYIFN